ncbi:MAG TPA: RebB family R body protein [Acidobacteriaceae bacterium]|nr:RebB family R body protein [Acidobacteriaceae bacterium]
MAYPTAVNNQITDSVSQSDVLTLGASPAMAASMLYQAVAQAMGNAANNATVLQQQGSMVIMAVASTACAVIFAQKPKSAV